MDQVQVLEKFNWYCGVNNTETLDNFKWDLNHTLYNTCFTDLVYTVPHLVFIILGILVLFVIGCCTRTRKEKYHFLIQYPGHNLRWVINFVFLSLTLCELGESILSDVEVYRNEPTRPHLYIPAVLVLVAAVLTMVYYTQMEVWSRKHMSWLLLVYWMAALGGEVVRFLHFYHDLNGLDYTTLRVVLNIVAIGIYFLFLMLELNVVRKKVRSYRNLVCFEKRNWLNRQIYMELKIIITTCTEDLVRFSCNSNYCT